MAKQKQDRAVQVVEALAVVRPVVHCDVSPRNLMLNGTLELRIAGHEPHPDIAEDWFPYPPLISCCDGCTYYAHMSSLPRLGSCHVL